MPPGGFYCITVEHLLQQPALKTELHTQPIENIPLGIGGMRQRVSKLGGKLNLENTFPERLVVTPSTSAEVGEDSKQLKY